MKSAIKIFLLLFSLHFANQCGAAVYDLADDWSDSSNPNGPWSYNDIMGMPLSFHTADWDLTNEHFAVRNQLGSPIPEFHNRGVPMAFKSVGVSGGPFGTLMHLSALSVCTGNRNLRE